MLALRRATAADAGEAARIIAAALAEYGLPFEPEGRDADVATFGAKPEHDDLVAEDDGRVIGVASIGPQGAEGVAWISKVASSSSEPSPFTRRAATSAATTPPAPSPPATSCSTAPSPECGDEASDVAPAANANRAPPVARAFRAGGAPCAAYGLRANSLSKKRPSPFPNREARPVYWRRGRLTSRAWLACRPRRARRLVQPQKFMQTLGKYRLIAEIARGGMGIVYLAVASGPAGFSKLFVVKELKPELVEQATFLDMFLEGARRAKRPRRTRS